MTTCSPTIPASFAWATTRQVAGREGSGRCTVNVTLILVSVSTWKALTSAEIGGRARCHAVVTGHHPATATRSATSTISTGRGSRERGYRRRNRSATSRRDSSVTSTFCPPAPAYSGGCDYEPHDDPAAAY